MNDKKTKRNRRIVFIIFIINLILFFGMLHYRNIKGPKNETIMAIIDGKPGIIFIFVSMVLISPLSLVYLYETSDFDEKYGKFTEELLINKRINVDSIKHYSYNHERMKNYFKKNYPDIVPYNFEELPRKEQLKIDDEVSKIIETFSEEQIAEICSDSSYDEYNV